MKKEKFINELKTLSKELELSFKESSDKIRIDFSGWTGIRLFINLKDNKVDFYIYIRTDSWHYTDERTDIHDSVSILLSSWLLKSKKFTISFYNIGHPAVGYLDDFEIYARYLVPTQQGGDYTTLSEQSVKEYAKLIIEIYSFHFAFWKIFGGCPCNECKSKLGIKYDYKNSINSKLQKSIDSALGKGENYNLKDRKLPTWQYYRNFDKGISIINSQNIAYFLKFLNESDKEYKIIESINGNLLVNSNLHNFISSNTAKEISRVFKILEPKIKDNEIVYSVFENKVLGIGKKNTLIFDDNSGSVDFKKERDLLKLRHDKEFKLLFQPSQIIWKSKIDDSDFEDLIAELLRREPNVIRVRKVAHTNERDGGRDLFVEIKVIPQNNQKIPENVNPYEVIRVIVQCKAYQNGVKKSDITDIRDTIEFYECKGYFVVVSSYLKSSLTDHLDSLREKGKFWVDWWTKQEIEERIRKNEDLLNLYPNVFEAKKD